MEKVKVLIGPSTFAQHSNEPLNRLIEKGYEIIDNPYKRKLTKNEVIDLLCNGVKGIVAGLETLDREVMEKTQVKVISRSGSGMSNVDIKAARELGIKVFSTPTAPVNSVAELTLGCVLSLLRNISLIDRSMHGKQWDKRIGNELRGKKVAIVGYGKIGQRVGHLVSAFGAQVLIVDPGYNDSSDSSLKYELHEALKIADIITLHASSSDLILGESEFEKMKNGVLLLNAGRGELINEEALLKNIENGKIAGAWLDTFHDEPYAGPLCNYEQVLLTSHVGSYTYECRESMEIEAVENLIHGFED